MNAFLDAYDTVLARWPVPVEALDVPTPPFGTTRVNACGAPHAPPLVLLPGGGATSTVWFAHVAAFARTHRVYAVDLLTDPGRGAPQTPPVTREELLTWLDAVLDGLPAPTVDLCGHSYGGWIALAYALRSPARVRRLALLDPTTCFAAMSPRYLLHALPLLARPTQAGVRRLFGWEAGGLDRLDEGWLDLAAHAVDQPSARTVLPKRPTYDQLRALAMPSLVLLAGDSRAHAAEKVAATARRLLPDATVTVLPDVAHHTVPFRHPDRVGAALTAFLAG